MELLGWPVKILFSFLLGAVIGLEREINERKNIAGSTNKNQAILGLRSFSLISGMGAICGLLFSDYLSFSLLIAGTFSFLLIVYYIFDSYYTRDIGFTTELAIIYSFILGFLIANSILPIQVIIALTVLLVLLMARKEKIKDLVEDISKREMNALISFALLAFVILPFLPNQTYALSDLGNVEEFFKNAGISVDRFAHLELINPFKLWFIVVLITGVDVLGYILERTIGRNKGWLLTSLVGGFVSSTATTVTIAQESKEVKESSFLVAGAIFATLVSFVPIIVLLITLNSALFLAFLPVLAVIMVATLLAGLFFLQRSNSRKDAVINEKQIEESHHIFDLGAALRFMGIYLAINIVSKISLELFGNAGFLATTMLGALTGIDAVVVNTAQLAGGRVDIQLGVWALLLANSVNLLAKSAYSYMQGSKSFANKFFISMMVIIVSSVVAAAIF